MESNQNFDIIKEIQDVLVDIHLERLLIDEERIATTKIIDTFTESYQLICSLILDEKPDLESIVIHLDEMWNQFEVAWSKLAHLSDKKQSNEEKGGSAGTPCRFYRA